MAPMSLVTYEETRPWARAIKRCVVARDMPPWHMSKSAPRQWPDVERWRVEDELLHRPPDLIIESEPWTHPAVGQDQWFPPSVDAGLTEDR